MAVQLMTVFIAALLCAAALGGTKVVESIATAISVDSICWRMRERDCEKCAAYDRKVRGLSLNICPRRITYAQAQRYAAQLTRHHRPNSANDDIRGQRWP